MSLIGRIEEQRELQRYCESTEAEFVVVYGRRRVGKTYLVRRFFDERFAFYSTGVAGGRKSTQLKAFNATLRRYGGSGTARDWFDAFEQLRVLLDADDVVRDESTGKMVVFIDEMPWLDTARSGFLEALEFFWNSWASSRNDLLLIACGSATSWIAKNLLNNHGGLHNRVTGTIQLPPFTLWEAEQLLKSYGLALSRREVMEAYMVFGGVPYYLRLLNRRYSLNQNIDLLCFAQSGRLRDEFDSLFRALFRHSERHVAIIRALATKQAGIGRAEILRLTGLSDGGTFSTALSELEQCGFIRAYKDFTREAYGETYQLIDPFTLFWLRFVETADDPHWWSTNRSSSAVRAWTGRAFELLCLWHVPQVLRALGVWGVSVSVQSWRSRPAANPGAQIDLVLNRADNVVNLCEIKWVGSGSAYEIDKAYSGSLMRKAEAFAAETGTAKALHTTLITPGGIVRNQHSSVVQSVVTADDLFVP